MAEASGGGIDDPIENAERAIEEHIEDLDAQLAHRLAELGPEMATVEEFALAIRRLLTEDPVANELFMRMGRLRVSRLGVAPWELAALKPPDPDSPLTDEFREAMRRRLQELVNEELALYKRLFELIDAHVPPDASEEERGRLVGELAEEIPELAEVSARLSELIESNPRSVLRSFQEYDEKKGG